MVIVTIGIVGLTVAGNYFYNMAIARNEKSFLIGDPALEGSGVGEAEKNAALEKENLKWRTEHHAEDVFLTSNDNLKLRGIFIPGKGATNKTIILAHGYTGKSEEMTKYARYYYDTYGFNVLMPDARGHGESEGDYIGMGWHERRDYVQWINYVVERIGATSEIALHGVSMGGATVMMTSGEELPPQVKFIVEDCGYSDVMSLFAYQLDRLFQLPEWPLLPWTSMITKIRAGFTFGEASSVQQVAKAKVPMIFIHGDADAFVPFEMVYDVYEAANVPKELVIVEGANHGNAFDIDAKSDEQAMRKTIDQYIQAYMS